MRYFKQFAMVGLALLLAQTVGAQESASAPETKPYSSFRVSLFPGATLWDKPNVKGADVGLATKSETVEGVQAGIFYAETSGKMTGAQCGIVALSEDLDGAKCGVVAISRNVRGYQAGVVNIANDLTGYQKGWVNINRSLCGVQVGAVNVSRQAKGVQVGVFNYTETLQGLQFGVLNIIAKSTLPFMVLMNASF